MDPQTIGILALAMLVLAVVLMVAGDSRVGRAVGPAFTAVVLAIALIMALGGGE
jgi:hypothetical protein